MGCRDISVGVDTFQYAYSYNEALYMSWPEVLMTKDPAWLTMEKLSSYIYPNYYFWQCLYAIIYISIYSKIIKRYCRNKLLAIVIFLSAGLYTYAFNISRQMLSIAFFMCSWDLLNRNKISKSILVYVLALATHMSSIIALPILLMTKLNITKQIEKWLPIILFIILHSFTSLITNLGAYFPQYEMYLDNSLETHGGGLIKIVWGINVLFSIYIYYFSSNATKLYKISALATLIYVGTSFLGMSFNYAERMGYVFMPFVLFVYDQVYMDIKQREIRSIVSFVEVVCFLCFFYRAFNYLEYKSFF